MISKKDAIIQKPNLYRGQPLPLIELNSDQFEDFVYSTLSEISKNHGFIVVGGPQNSSDHGFDVTGKRNSDNSVVCIQCKRLSSNMYNSVIGLELAKVALKSLLEGSVVKEHYIITTGNVSKEVHSALREKERKVLIGEALKALAEEKHLKELIKECTKKEINLKEVIEIYIQKLEVLCVWSGRDYDQQIGRVWTRVTDTIDRFFSLEIALERFPRPNFNLEDYTASIKIDSENIVDLIAFKCELPPNIQRESSSDPVGKFKALPYPQPNDINDVEQISYGITSTPQGWCSIICGPGGSGKSTALMQVTKNLSSELKDNELSPLPILINLNQYRGSLTELIHRRLHITYGDWRSLPHSFFLLLDGLDEIPDGRAQDFFTELNEILQEERTACVVSVREAGMRHPISFNRIGQCWMLAPLSFRLCFDIVERFLPESKKEDFLKEFRTKVFDFGENLLTLPFGFMSAIKLFLDTGSFPNTAQDLMLDVFNNRLKHNLTRANNTLDNNLKAIPIETIGRLAEVICYELRVVHQKTIVDKKTGQKIVSDALKKIKDENIFGAQDITNVGVLALAIHYEVFIENADGLMNAGHDIVADFLARKDLAKNWRIHCGHLQSILAQDSWVYASSYILLSEREEFLSIIASIDLVLASRCVLQMGTEHYSLLESLILEADDKSSKVSFARASTAMAILKTPLLTSRLSLRIKEKDFTRKYHAERALALSGDKELLKKFLDDNDSVLSSGMQVSGGSYDMWHAAPPMIRTELAREKILLSLSSGDERNVLSLQTIGYYGDQSDFEVVEKIVRITKNPTTFYNAVDCLYKINQQSAIELLKVLNKDNDFIRVIYAMEMLTAYKINIDTSRLFQYLIELENIDDDKYHFLLKIEKIINQQILPTNGEILLKNKYANSNEFQRSIAWGIVIGHRLESFDEIALTILEKDGNDEIGDAARFCRARSSEFKFKDALIKALKNKVFKLEEDVLKNHWYLERVLECLLEMNEKEVVASSVERILQRYVPEHTYSRKEWKKNIKLGHSQISNSEYNFFIQYDLCSFLNLASSVSTFLSSELITLSLTLDISTSSSEIKQSYLELGSRLSSEQLDIAIQKIDDSEQRLLALSYLKKLGSTPTRLNIFISDLGKGINDLRLDSHISEIIKIYWCDELEVAIIREVVGTEWDDVYGIQSFDRTEVTVANLISRQGAETIIKPLLETTIGPVSKEILQFWYDAAIARRNIK